MIWNIWQMRAQYSSAASCVFVVIFVDKKGNNNVRTSVGDAAKQAHALQHINRDMYTVYSPAQSNWDPGQHNILYIDHTVSSCTLRSLTQDTVISLCITLQKDFTLSELLIIRLLSQLYTSILTAEHKKVIREGMAAPTHHYSTRITIFLYKYGWSRHEMMGILKVSNIDLFWKILIWATFRKGVGLFNSNHLSELLHNCLFTSLSIHPAVCVLNQIYK